MIINHDQLILYPRSRHICVIQSLKKIEEIPVRKIREAVSV